MIYAISKIEVCAKIIVENCYREYILLNPDLTSLKIASKEITWSFPVVGHIMIFVF